MRLPPDLVRLLHLQLSAKAFYALPAKACLNERYQVISRERFRLIHWESVEADALNNYGKVCSSLPSGLKDGILDIVSCEVERDGIIFIGHLKRSYCYYQQGFRKWSLEELVGNYLYGMILHRQKWFGTISAAYTYDRNGLNTQTIYYHNYTPIYTLFYDNKRLKWIQPHNPYWSMSAKEKWSLVASGILLNSLVYQPRNSRQFSTIVVLPVALLSIFLFEQPTHWLMKGYRWICQQFDG